MQQIIEKNEEELSDNEIALLLEYYEKVLKDYATKFRIEL